MRSLPSTPSRSRGPSPWDILDAALSLPPAGFGLPPAALARGIAEGRTASPLRAVDESPAVRETLDQAHDQLSVYLAGEPLRQEVSPHAG